MPYGRTGEYCMQWAVAIASFLASAVEFVEAFTIVLVVGVTINWRSSLVGALAAAATLAVIVGTLGVALVQYVPIGILRLVVGIILILFGLKWLKKAILRYSGLKALHDEEAIFEETMAELRARGETITPRLQPFGVALAYKAVLLEGLEVAFIVRHILGRRVFSHQLATGGCFYSHPGSPLPGSVFHTHHSAQTGEAKAIGHVQR